MYSHLYSCVVFGTSHPVTTRCLNLCQKLVCENNCYHNTAKFEVVYIRRISSLCCAPVMLDGNKVVGYSFVHLLMLHCTLCWYVKC